MPLRRPPLGAPWDSRLTAPELARLLSQGPRPFDPATDVDLLDEITAQLAEIRAEARANAPGAYLGLVRNGAGILGDSTNFSSLIFDPTHGGASVGGEIVAGGGSFRSDMPSQAVFSDNLIAVNPQATYRLKMNVKATGQGAGVFFAGIAAFDIDGLSIQATHWMYQPGTLTTLSAPLNPGDTVIQVASTANWNNVAGTQDYQRSVIWWDYTNSAGYRYPPETYSRNWLNDAYTPGALTVSTVPLRVPYAGPARPAGTPLSNGSAGATFQYAAAAGLSLVNNTWASVSGVLSGVQDGGAANGTSFPAGTAYIKVLLLVNYGSAAPSPKTWVNMVQLSEVVT